MKNLIFHSIPGSKAKELCQELSKHCEKLFTSTEGFIEGFPSAQNLAEEDQESLIIAFPDSDFEGKDLQTASNEILASSFLQIQRFVQTRMKKRFGQILILVDAGVNGLLYGENPNAPFLALQGGFAALSKTVSKEYSKRGIISNVLYIDWQTIPLQEVAYRAKTLLEGNSSLKGQVFALDGGRWL
jgi:hypothetical protein